MLTVTRVQANYRAVELKTGVFQPNFIRKTSSFKRNGVYLLRILFIAILIWLIIFPHQGVYADSAGSARTVYLPLMAYSVVSSAEAPPCLQNEQAQQIANLMKTHPDQKRQSMNCNPILARVAQERAQDMGVRRYFGHVNPDGHGANYLVQQAGYVLPSYYNQAPNGNNIESIGAGPSTAQGMWDAWMGSSKHHTHLIGTDTFFAEQIDYGIGFAQVPGSPYQYYWVVLTAKRGP